ncbi:MAG: hypothetical protein IT320_00220 [Anaerolineae bacterium]|nr:hypothetical protein [Anaerolineae bacterium]
MLIGLIIFAGVVIVIVRSSGSFESKATRKNDEILRNDEAYIISDDGEIVEYSEEKVSRVSDRTLLWLFLI